MVIKIRYEDMVWFLRRNLTAQQLDDMGDEDLGPMLDMHYKQGFRSLFKLIGRLIEDIQVTR